MKEDKKQKKVAISQLREIKNGSFVGRLKETMAQIIKRKREFQMKQRQKRYEKGEVSLPVFRVGPNKKGMAALWILMIGSLTFGVYKNFTAIDKETIYEKSIVEAKVTDTNQIESFVERFASVYHAWGNGQDSQERQEMLNRYMTDTLAKLNGGVITSDCPTSSVVIEARVCEVKDISGSDFKVRYSVRQSLEETLAEELAGVQKNDIPVVATSAISGQKEKEELPEPNLEQGFNGTQSGEMAEDRKEELESAGEDLKGETERKEPEVATKYGAAVTVRTESISNGDGSKTVVTMRESFYEVELHVDEDGSMVITTNPTACGVPGKSAYTVSEYQTDGSVDASVMAEIEDFLNTFFALYPAATDKELAYYAAPGIMDVIGVDYVYDGLYSVAYYKEDGDIKAHVYVKYLDQVAKMTQFSEYTLTLKKGENWKIVKVE